MRDLFAQIHARGLLASEYHRNQQEVESCYERTQSVPRVRLTLNLHTAPTKAPESPAALTALQQVLDLAAQGLLRNLRVDVDPCGDSTCRGIRLALWYDDESATTPAMCA